MVEYTILLEGLEVTMGLGIHPEERAAPQRVIVSVEMTCAYPVPPEDQIEAVIDYDFLRAEICALAASRHFELQETFCEQVSRLALRDVRVIRARVRSTKRDIYQDAQIGCEIVRSRA